MAPTLSVQEALDAMQTACRAGDFTGAAQLGACAPVQLAVPKEALSMGAAIASGSESTVYRGTYGGQSVAVKKARIGNPGDLARFRREVAIMSGVNHPNVVPILGARAIPPTYLLVMPAYEHSLEHALHHQGWRPDWSAILGVATQLASALVAVHEKQVCHRDIKPGNILMEQGGAPRLSDFGLSDTLESLAGYSAIGHKPSGGFHKARMQGTMEYMAPEVLTRGKHSLAADVWALAVTLNELSAGVVPYSDCTQDNPKAHTVLEMGYGRLELATAIVAEGLRPLVPDGAPPLWEALMEKCWEPDPVQRPAAPDLLATLGRIQAPPPRAAPSRVEEQGDGPASTDAASQAEAPQSGTSGAAGASHAGGEAWPEPGWGTSAPDHLPTLKCGAYETAGMRGEEKMEDRHVQEACVGGYDHCQVAAVFDGHRGWQAAEYARQHTLAHVRAAWGAASIEDCMRSVFSGLEAGFKAQDDAAWGDRLSRMGSAAGARPRPGATAQAVLIWEDQLVVGNAGDCRAVLCRGGEAIQLTRDHTADDAHERERVTAAGGAVAWRVNGWRVGEAGIQVTRSLGDFDLKEGGGLTATPEVSTTTLSGEEEFLLLASDGLFDKLSNEEVVGLVHDTVKDATLCAKRVVMEALTRGSGDNITAVVIFLQPVSTLENIYQDGQSKYKVTKTLYGSRRAMLEALSKSSANEINDSR